MKNTFQRRLTLNFLLLFAIFTAGIVIFGQQSAKRYKTEALEERLDAFADLVSRYTARNAPPDSLMALLPADLRLTLVAHDGTVTYDNLFADAAGLENHAGRPEILEARQKGTGTDIRTSTSNHRPYLYYAKYYGNATVRVALPYDEQVRSLLKPDRGFLYVILFLFVIGLVFIHWLGERFGKTIRELRDFSMAVGQNTPQITAPRFPKDEFGEISRQLVRDYNKMILSEQQLRREHEKLFQHVQSSAEGICFFNPDRTVAFYNGLFQQYLNTLNSNTIFSPEKLLQEEGLRPVSEFLDHRQGENDFEVRIARQGKEFLVRVNVFEDDSFEVILNDITHPEKTRRLKQEMTGNIAHELRTPVTSIRGFLETVLENDLPPEKERDFLAKAYAQTQNLSELIADMSLLTKIEQGPESFDKQRVRVAEVIEKVRADLAEGLRERHIVFESTVPQELFVRGNENLIYSIFRNLTDNVVRHAGENVRILIRHYDTRDGRACFSFADTGIGIADETQLNRLFERFYRLTEGRTRDTGGSGLGLSIVKNAVLFHRGGITVKNRTGGGLEFLFDLET